MKSKHTAKHSAALAAYIMGNDPQQVAEAQQAVMAERAAGATVFTRTLSGAEQRRLGMPPPSQRPEFATPAPTPAAQTAPPTPTGDIQRLREAVDRAEERYGDAFESYSKLQEQLDAAETQGYSDQWSSEVEEPVEIPEPLPEDEIEERQPAYDDREEPAAAGVDVSNLSPYAQDAFRAMQQ